MSPLDAIREGHSCTAFLGPRKVATGSVPDVALAARAAAVADPTATLLVFDDTTSQPIELDLSGSADEVTARLTIEAVPSGPGRPKLGVVAREVTLLPRHWEWLSSQPGGASVALRKLVETARKANHHQDQVRSAQDAANRFMTAMAGNLYGFEDATRALYSRDRALFERHMEDWPADIAAHARQLSMSVFAGREQEPVSGSII